MKLLYMIFTFHYVSIKTVDTLKKSSPKLNLHSTMYLLKLLKILSFLYFVSLFTFHYVSIKTCSASRLPLAQLHLHSTMYLLKPGLSMKNAASVPNLHSTMYLLKPTDILTPRFHHPDLHSTMYLLKHVVLNDIILIS